MRELHRGLDNILPIVDKPLSKFYVLAYAPPIGSDSTRHYPVGKRFSDRKYCLYYIGEKSRLKSPVNVDFYDNYHIDETIQEVLQQASSYLGNTRYHLYEFESLKEFLDSEV